MAVNFRGFHIPVPHQLLNRTDVDTIFQQMCDKIVPQRMATVPRTDRGLLLRFREDVFATDQEGESILYLRPMHLCRMSLAIRNAGKPQNPLTISLGIEDQGRTKLTH